MAAEVGVRPEELPAAITRGGDPMGSSESRTTTDHDEIRKWVEAHDGSPAAVGGTGNGDLGVLRIDFPGGALSGARWVIAGRRPVPDWLETDLRMLDA
jgi:hypothetical protein